MSQRACERAAAPAAAPHTVEASSIQSRPLVRTCCARPTSYVLIRYEYTSGKKKLWLDVDGGRKTTGAWRGGKTRYYGVHHIKRTAPLCQREFLRLQGICGTQSADWQKKLLPVSHCLVDPMSITSNESAHLPL